MLDITSLINWKALTVNALISYSLAWLYFFLTLGLFRDIFGKKSGFVVNYLLSWAIMLILFYVLTKMNPVGDHQMAFVK